MIMYTSVPFGTKLRGSFFFGMAVFLPRTLRYFIFHKILLVYLLLVSMYS